MSEQVTLYRTQAKLIQRALDAAGRGLSKQDALELVAAAHGKSDWKGLKSRPGSGRLKGAALEAALRSRLKALRGSEECTQQDAHTAALLLDLDEELETELLHAARGGLSLDTGGVALPGAGPASLNAGNKTPPADHSTDGATTVQNLLDNLGLIGAATSLSGRLRMAGPDLQQTRLTSEEPAPPIELQRLLINIQQGSAQGASAAPEEDPPTLDTGTPTAPSEHQGEGAADDERPVGDELSREPARLTAARSPEDGRDAEEVAAGKINFVPDDFELDDSATQATEQPGTPGVRPRPEVDPAVELPQRLRSLFLTPQAAAAQLGVDVSVAGDLMGGRLERYSSAQLRYFMGRLTAP